MHFTVRAVVASGLGLLVLVLFLSLIRVNLDGELQRHADKPHTEKVRTRSVNGVNGPNAPAAAGNAPSSMHLPVANRVNVSFYVMSKCVGHGGRRQGPQTAPG